MNSIHMPYAAPFRAETRLAQLCQSLRIGDHLADSPLLYLDSCLSQLHDLGFFNSTIVVGPIVLSRSYGFDGPVDSGELIQAAVTTDRGAAAVFWDSEDYAQLRNEEAFLSEAYWRVRPLRDCAPAIRSVVWPHIEPLLIQLFGRCKLLTSP